MSSPDAAWLSVVLFAGGPFVLMMASAVVACMIVAIVQSVRGDQFEVRAFFVRAAIWWVVLLIAGSVFLSGWFLHWVAEPFGNLGG